MRRVSAWICLLMTVVYVLQGTAIRVMAADGSGGEAIAGADRRAGEAIVDEQPRAEKKSNIWGWVVAGIAVLAAGYGGFLLADSEDGEADDAKKSAGAAEESAEAAEEAAAATEAVFTYTVFITGTFKANKISAWCDGGADFTPSMTFQMAQDDYPGGVRDYSASYKENGVFDCGDASSGRGGSYEQVRDTSIMIRVDDSFYIGKATLSAEDTLRLANGTVLYAQQGARGYLLKNQ